MLSVPSTGFIGKIGFSNRAAFGRLEEFVVTVACTGAWLEFLLVDGLFGMSLPNQTLLWLRTPQWHPLKSGCPL